MQITYTYSQDQIKELIKKDWEEKIGKEECQGLSVSDIRIMFCGNEVDPNQPVTFEFEVFE